MLISLHIENIAVIKTADIDFTAGFTVLTGETGAGKSIIIDSIALILGAKQSKELIRSGEETAMVSALFGDMNIRALNELSALGLAPDEDGMILLSRTISTSGKSTARMNGRAIPMSLLKDVAKHLIAIHGQHDNMTLLDPEKHINYLDSFASLGTLPEEYSECYNRYRELERKIAEMTSNEREKARRLEFLKFQIDEIAAAKLKPGEEEALEKKRAKLQNSENINRLSHQVYASLYQNEKGTSALDRLRRSVKALDTLSAVIPEAGELSGRLEQAGYEIEDIALTAEAFADDSDGDPTAGLDRIESRLDEISKLERKYGDTIPDILAFLEKSKKELESIELSEERLNECVAEKKKLLPVLEKKAAEMTRLRTDAAAGLEERIISELAYLDMKGVTFSVEILPVQGGFTPRGADRVEFLISTNKGEPLKPLAKIASGGELSRIMLAIKSVLAEKDFPDTMIFDEVDTGVSGKTSQKIGIKLRALAMSIPDDRMAQVICITHSAQIAALADNHYLISKKETDGRVRTSVTPLDKEGRVNEIARIMGGINITDRLRETAREMIDEKI